MNTLLIERLVMMGLGIFLMIARTFLPGTVIIILGILMTLYSRYPSIKNIRAKADQANICSIICNHKKSKSCIDSRCHCCIIIKEDIVVGHHNSPLQ